MRIPVFFEPYFDSLNFEPNLRSFIVSEMTAPHRHYHTLGHLALMIQYVYGKGGNGNLSFHPASTFKREIIAAIFFHDIVYDVHEADNEEQSAATAKIWLDSERHDLDLVLVEELILATKDHDHNGFNPRLWVEFIRADLSILWSSPQVYEWYAHGIRKEYAHVPNEAYREGRAKIISRLADDVHQPKQRAAQRNVDWELNALEQGVFDVS